MRTLVERHLACEEDMPRQVRSVLNTAYNAGDDAKGLQAGLEVRLRMSKNNSHARYFGLTLL